MKALAFFSAFTCLAFSFSVDTRAQDAAAKPAKPQNQDAKVDHRVELDAALQEYNATISDEVEKIAKAINDAFQRATAKGDLELAKKAQEAEKRLREEGEPPADAFMRPVREAAQRRINRAAKALHSRYAAVSRDILKTGNVAEAAAVMEEAADIMTQSQAWRVQARSPAERQTPERPRPTNATPDNAQRPLLQLRHQAVVGILGSQTCASIVLDYYGVKVDPVALNSRSNMYSDICEAVGRLGFAWTNKPFSNDDIGFDFGLREIKAQINAGYPVIVDLTNAFGRQGNRVFIVCGYSDFTKTIFLLDPNAPAPGVRELTYAQLAVCWNSLGVERPFNGRSSLFTAPKRK